YILRCNKHRTCGAFASVVLERARKASRMATVSPVLTRRGHDHRRCATDALGHAEEISRREGLRFTEQRRHVLEALLASHVPASAYHVIDRLAEHGRRPAPVSLYRALNFLVDH